MWVIVVEEGGGEWRRLVGLGFSKKWGWGGGVTFGLKFFENYSDMRLCVRRAGVWGESGM